MNVDFTDCLFDIAILEILLNLSKCLFGELLAMNYFFFSYLLPIWIGLTVDWSSQRVLPKVIFEKEKERRKFRVPSFVTVYIFVYLQRESAVGSLSKFIASNVRCQRFAYQNKIDKK